MQTKRLFVGTFIDTSIIEYYYPSFKEDFDAVSTGKWVELENLHFTYKFLGDVKYDKIEIIKDSFKDLLIQYNSKIILKGLNVFPNPDMPRVLFANIYNRDNKILNVFKDIEKRAIELGFDKEKRKFKPHLTLKRIKSNKRVFGQILSEYRNIEIGNMTSFSVNLIESELTFKGPIYKVLT